MEFSNASYRFAKVRNEPLMFVMRHGATGDDDSYNSPENPPLTETGRAEAGEAGDYLKGAGVGVIFSSALHRAMESAEIVGKKLGVKVISVPQLDSLDIGDVASMASAEEADKLIKHHVANPEKEIPGGESLKSFQDRVDPELLSGVNYYFKTGKPAAFSVHHSVQHETGRLFNGDQDSALTRTGGLIAVYMTDEGLKAVPVFKPEKKRG